MGRAACSRKVVHVELRVGMVGRRRREPQKRCVLGLHPVCDADGGLGKHIHDGAAGHPCGHRDGNPPCAAGTRWWLASGAQALAYRAPRVRDKLKSKYLVTVTEAKDSCNPDKTSEAQGGKRLAVPSPAPAGADSGCARPKSSWYAPDAGRQRTRRAEARAAAVRRGRRRRRRWEVVGLQSRCGGPTGGRRLEHKAPGISGAVADGGKDGA
ncbi:hypothetical protein GGX14DRAFT_627600 [Mycena pura]|uniref:Uncharacterized protein n=1 Tax=Mycena pura TaxID=153505 RepID=A0AAD7E3P3_9AGAR|nr:hypothetical protein GGX14DRAFT_627600 [Mycena pura]